MRKGEPLSPLLRTYAPMCWTGTGEAWLQLRSLWSMNSTSTVRSQGGLAAGDGSIEKSCSSASTRVNKAKSGGRPNRPRQIPGLSFTSGIKPSTAHRAAVAGPTFGVGVRTDAPYPRQQPRADLKELSVYLIGWRGYFGFCETPSGVCTNLTNGPTTAARHSSGSNGEADHSALVELRPAASGPSLAAKPPCRPTWPLATQQQPRTIPGSPHAFLNRSALNRAVSYMLNPSNRRIRDPYVRWCGREESRDSPYPDFRATVGAFMLETARYSKYWVGMVRTRASSP